MAVCPSLGLLVTSNHVANTLCVFALLDGAKGGGGSGAGGGASGGAAGTSGGGGLALVCTLGGPGSRPPLRFKFNDGNSSGWMVFTSPSASGDKVPPPLLLVTDAGHDAVHVIDVAARAHSGYVGALGSIPGPRGVAARGGLVAISCWTRGDNGDHVVRLFEGAGATWAPLRVMGGGFGEPGDADGQLRKPYGVRFSADGRGVVVTHSGPPRGPHLSKRVRDQIDRLSLFCVGDGAFVRRVAAGLDGPLDVEECNGGWLVACWGSYAVEFVGGDGVTVGRAALGKPGSMDGEFMCPSALALLPGLGLVVRDDKRVQVFQ